jgi:hypothetical protein
MTKETAVAKWKRDFSNADIAREKEDGQWKLCVAEDTRLEAVEALGKKRTAGILMIVVH